MAQTLLLGIIVNLSKVTYMTSRLKQTSSPARTALSEAKEDLRISWKLFKDNARAFLITEVVAITGLAIIIVWWSIVFVQSFEGLPRPITLDLIQFDPSLVLLGGSMFLIAAWFFGSFLCCVFGLAHDIMSSGDMFANFSSAFTYFRRYWWQYSILALLTGILCFYPTVILFVGVFPALTPKGTFQEAMRENFQVLKQNKRRVVTSWSVFFLIFYSILGVTTGLGFLALLTLDGIPAMGLFIGANLGLLVAISVCAPIMALVATRIYNTCFLAGMPAQGETSVRHTP